MSNNQDNTNAAALAVTAADATETPVRASENRRLLEERARRLADASQRKQALAGKISKMKRAQQAAQADAAEAKAKWAAKLRESDGELTRDIQKLRANERAAFSLVEEYEVMASEIAAELPRLELELAEVANQCFSVRDAVAREAADQAYEQLLAQAGDSLAAAFALFAEAENVGVYPTEASTAQVVSRFFARLGAEVSRRLDSAAVAERVEQQLALPALELDAVNMQLAKSPSRMSALRHKVENPTGKTILKIQERGPVFPY